MNIVIVAGEASGDNLGGKLAAELKSIDNSISLSGIGGQNMRAAGLNTHADISETSVVGIIEILRHYPRLRRILTRIKTHIKNKRPDLLILIDYPEFNLKLATYAKKLGIKVLFYVSPQLWAWRTGRVKKIKQCVDLMAVLFPFEVDFYKKNNIPVCLVRHPLIEDSIRTISNSANNDNVKKLGIFPGSRKSEIKRLLPVMLEAANSLESEYPDLSIMIPVAPNLDIEELKALSPYTHKITYSSDNFYEVIEKCDVIVVASGTATLQIGLMGKAMVIIYKISPITHRLFSHLVKVDHIGLPNIILGRREFTELVQTEVSAESLTKEIRRLINDVSLTKKMDAVKQELHSKLAAGIDSKELAFKALQLAKSSQVS